jgi:DeoR/GlpR family transcriptional regulator of sugar metabolism
MTAGPPSARREIIAQRLASGLSVSASILAEEFSVSEDAIRRDLRALAAEGRCRRVYGGALPLSPASTPFNDRAVEGIDRKTSLALAAASLARKGEVLFLDNSSANLVLAGQLPTTLNLTVVTNSVPIAAAIYERPGITLIVIGGALSRQVGGFVDSSAVLAVQQLSIDRCFLGVCALSIDKGACAFDISDAAFKRVLVAASDEVVALVVNEKLETRAPHRVAGLDAFSKLILEKDAPAALANEMARLGPDIVFASASQPEA